MDGLPIPYIGIYIKIWALLETYKDRFHNRTTFEVLGFGFVSIHIYFPLILKIKAKMMFVDPLLPNWFNKNQKSIFLSNVDTFCFDLIIM